MLALCNAEGFTCRDAFLWPNREGLLLAQLNSLAHHSLCVPVSETPILYVALPNKHTPPLPYHLALQVLAVQHSWHQTQLQQELK